MPNLALSGHKRHLSSQLSADSLTLIRLKTIAKERSVSQSGQDFGANDWLVEEMFERYQADPTSVPSEWVTYFQQNPQPTTPAVKAGTPPTPKPVTPPNIAPQTSAPVAPVAQAPVQTQPVVRSVDTPLATPAQPVAKPIPTLITPGASSLNQFAEYRLASYRAWKLLLQFQQQLLFVLSQQS